MNKTLLKQTSILSVILGVALGILTLIPFIGKIAFIILMCLASAIIIIFMLKVELLDLLSIKESVILGAIIGFVSFIAFCVVYLPFVAILGKVFGLYSLYGISIALQAGSTGIIILMVLFMGVLSATINAFTAFLTFYLAEFLGMCKKDDENDKDISFKL